jgi:hypothetical protein
MPAGFPDYALVIPVHLFVYDAASGTPTISVTPTTLEVSTPVATHPAAVSFTVSNGGTQDLAWEGWSESEWISIAPPDGEGPAGYSETVDIYVHPEGVAPGTYNGFVHIYHNAPGSSRTVLVQLTITP